MIKLNSGIKAYENSLIYKEKTKKIHDSKIKNRVFNVGDRVLLFKSQLKIFSGKLKTRWTGPFTVAQVFPYGTVELSQTDGPNFKVNGHRLKHYFGGDIHPYHIGCDSDLQTFPIEQHKFRDESSLVYSFNKQTLRSHFADETNRFQDQGDVIWASKKYKGDIKLGSKEWNASLKSLIQRKHKSKT
ncbi:hypothetical protein Tco_1031635 [Tanacetum coccineum]|uniref:Reverse transcriptase domain-containing protein n=1 Tax=Tanacetum coccineum TaxID=301880 RepID=A0ABQ5GBA5_9ASTR